MNLSLSGGKISLIKGTNLNLFDVGTHTHTHTYTRDIVKPISQKTLPYERTKAKLVANKRLRREIFHIDRHPRNKTQINVSRSL